MDPLVRAALLARETERTRTCVLGARAAPAAGLERFDVEYRAWARSCHGMALLGPAADAACGISPVDQPVCRAMRAATADEGFTVNGIDLLRVEDLDALTAVHEATAWQPFLPIDATSPLRISGGITAVAIRQGNLAVRLVIGLVVESGFRRPADADARLERAGIDWSPGQRWVWPNLQFATNLDAPIAGEQGYALMVEGADLAEPLWGSAAGEQIEGSAVLSPESLVALQLGARLVLAGLDGPAEAPRIAWRLEVPTEGLATALASMRAYYADGLDADLAASHATGHAGS
ncbi:MAG TPA: hypothetical protein VLA56_17105 [Pseudomonadales bacterium]|nr:hypothetical protein [Pseudomonadales bacterium]